MITSRINSLSKAVVQQSTNKQTKTNKWIRFVLGKDFFKLLTTFFEISDTYHNHENKIRR